MILKRRRPTLTASPRSITQESWWRVEIATRARATFTVFSGGAGHPRQFLVTIHIPLLLRARSLAAAQCQIPGVLVGLSSQQIATSCSLFGTTILPDYRSLTGIELQDPGEIWLVEASPVENEAWSSGRQI